MNTEIDQAKEEVKKYAYDYVTGGFESHYDNFQEFLTQETDCRSGLWALIVDDMAKTKKEYEDSPLTKLIWFMAESLDYSALYEEYLKDCIEIVLSLPELKRYHDKVEKLYKKYFELKNLGEDDRVDCQDLLAKEIGIEL